MKRKYLTQEQAFQKLKHYCNYQERSHHEVRQKAYQLGQRKSSVEELLAKLIQDGVLNEERFAKIFSGGKFRMKQWGRLKIKNELKLKKISEYCIRKGLLEIDESEYQKTLRQMAAKKWKSINSPGTNQFVKMAKTRNYLLQKGFEPSLVMTVINELGNK